MSRAAVFFLLLIAPLLALLLALLGWMTLPANPTGWFLLLVGVAFTAGLILDFAIRKNRFWEEVSTMPAAREERGDRSLWFISNESGRAIVNCAFGGGLPAVCKQNKALVSRHLVRR